MPNTDVDLWQTFDFTDLSTANLEANDNNSTIAGQWTVTSSQFMAMGSSAEILLAGTVNGSLTDSTGTNGLTVSCTAINGDGNCSYAFTPNRDNISFGFWFRCPTGLAGTFDEHDIFAFNGALGNRDLFVKARDLDGTNLGIFLFNPIENYTVLPIPITGGNWYWVTGAHLRNSNVGMKLQIYDSNSIQVGPTLTRPTDNAAVLDLQIGSVIGAGTSNAGSLLFDDLVVDWTDATFPLGPFTANTTKPVLANVSSVVGAPNFTVAAAATHAGLTFNGANSSGSLLTTILTLGSSAATVSTVTDSAGNTWQLAVRQAGAAGSSGRAELWYAANAKESTNRVTVTLTSTAAGTHQCGIQEWQNCSTSAPLDQTNSVSAASSLHGTGGITPTSSLSLVIAAWRSLTAYTLRSQPTGYSTVVPGGNRSNAAYKIMGAASSAEDPIWTVTGSTIAQGIIASFLPIAQASTGGGGPTLTFVPWGFPLMGCQ